MATLFEICEHRMLFSILARQPMCVNLYALALWILIIWTFQMTISIIGIHSAVSVTRGHRAKLGEFPAQVAIIRPNKTICGGTIVHENHVLTSARCVIDTQIHQRPLLWWTPCWRSVPRVPVWIRRSICCSHLFRRAIVQGMDCRSIHKSDDSKARPDSHSQRGGWRYWIRT